MLIYFSASARDLRHNLAAYKRIINTVYSLGHTVAHNWIESARIRMEREEYSFKDIDQIVKDAEAAIESSEVLIADATGGSAFGVGYEVAMALNKRKPVLVLLNKDSTQGAYSIGISNDLLRVKRYDANNLEKCIEKFIICFKKFIC